MEAKYGMILDLIDRAVGKTTALTEPEPLHQAHDEMWIAAHYIAQDDIDTAEITRLIFEEPTRAYLWACFLVSALSKTEKRIEEIEDGISWESEGMTFVASRIDS